MSKEPRVVLVAVPLMARSGVYRSTHDLVRAASAAGHQWQALIGMRPQASGDALATPGVREVPFDARGVGGISQIRALIDSVPEVRDADVIVSMITQTDIAVSRARAREDRGWIAWVRGKPWPAAGEQNLARRLLLRAWETRALRSADAVWATTPVLADEFASACQAAIVPAGIPSSRRIAHGEDATSPLVWAGRVDIDKRPELFSRIVELTGHPGRLYGDGPLKDRLASRRVTGLDWAGWRPSGELWSDASVFVGTSSREAFGRSAVEAAAAGIPIVIAREYGAAPLLFTDETLRRACVIDSADPEAWANAVRALLTDRQLRMAVSDHVHSNAQTLTIEASVDAAARRAAALLEGGCK
ncbi:MAG: glycosyl transferase [Microbacterium sp.]|nr:MAG: glycosyl transferase [Microbacterium sp.]PZU35483.1 MAG: glycosyl transferase [Microbacterium sp.]